MKKIWLVTAILIRLVNLSFGQLNDNLKIKREGFENYEDLQNKQKEARVDTLTYVDSTFKFQVKVPKWLKLMETGTIYAWGGMLPATKGIENAIVIKIVDKKEFKSFKEFTGFVIDDVGFGQMPKWSNSHKSVGKKVLDSFNNIGPTYKVYWMQGRLMYHCEYVLLETETAYLWIDFTATAETFDTNISKFEEFLTGFKTIK